MVEKRKENHEDSSESDQDISMEQNEMIDVDFDFFDPKEIDYLGIKNLLKQLFSNDAERIDLSEFADLLVSQSKVGTTVKVDGDSDPYALMSVVNLKKYQDKKFVKQLIEYIFDRIQKQPEEKKSKLKQMLQNQTIGLLVNERLVNMPVEIVPPMMKMLQEEIGWAIEDNEPFEFDYIMVLSKIYQEVEPLAEDVEDQDLGMGMKKKKKQKLNKSEEIFYFQPEDQLLEQHAELVIDFKLAKQIAVAEVMNSFQDFGIDPSRRIMLIPKSKFTLLVSELEKSFPAV